MKTLLTEQQVNKIHKGDYISARTVLKIGKIYRHGLTWYKCVDKIIYKINVCPHCKSKNTFHARQQKIYTLDNTRKYDNVYKTHISESESTKVFQKTDICLDCHKEFIIEIYVYKKIGLKNYLRGNY